MRQLRLIVLTGALACATTPTPVPVMGSSAAVAGLVGEWSGEYAATGAGRSGNIVFVLAANSDTASGDVLMTPRGVNQGPEAPGAGQRPPLLVRQSQVLRIAFLRTTGDSVSGVLDPYQDPDCRCEVRTTFSGRLSGNRIEGTFVTRTATGGVQQSGRWSVTRRR